MPDIECSIERPHERAAPTPLIDTPEGPCEIGYLAAPGRVLSSRLHAK